MTLQTVVVGLVLCLLSWASGTDEELSLNSQSSKFIAAKFRHEDLSTVFQHLALDGDSKMLFIGATNAILQLDAEKLEVKKTVKTGPHMDSPYCSWNGKDCIRPSLVSDSALLESEDNKSGRKEVKQNGTKRLLNNFNKILIIYKKGKLLIACGTLHQGMCSLLKLEDISKKVPVKEPVPVAANSANASTVAFIAPGRRDSNFALYAATTFTYEPYRGEFPAVATRSLRSEDIFNLEDQGDVSGQSSLTIMSEFRSDFRVQYVGGFYSDGFAYWASVQRENPTQHTAPYVSKLLRVCKDDLRYSSYSELPLECRGPDNSRYSLLRAIFLTQMGSSVVSSLKAEEYRDENDPSATEFFVGVFAKGVHPDKPSRESAVCIFPLKEIRAAFWYNIERCQNGNGNWNLPHFGFNRQCRNMSRFSVPKNDCLLGRVGGTIPVFKVAAVTFPDTLITSVAVDIVDKHTILFAGTSDGRIKKVFLESSSRGQEYSEIQLSKMRSPIASDMVVDENNKRLYAMAGNEIFKVRLPGCDQYRTCATCQQSGDRYCGWCTLSNKCSERSACPQAGVAHGWISVSSEVHKESSDSRCPRLAEPLEPQNASVFAPLDTEIRIRMVSLPPPNGESLYQCVFGEKRYMPARFVNGDTLFCNIPPYGTGNERPKVPRGQDHVIVPLKLWSSSSNEIFFEEKFIFYDCVAHQLCTSCVESRWNCQWCLLDNRCVHEDSLCSNEVFVIRNSAGSLFGGRRPSTLHDSTATNGDSQCPHIDSTKLKSREILLQNGDAALIRLPVKNLDSLLNQPDSPVSLDKLQCIVKVEGRTIETRGRLGEDGWVECEPKAFTYDQDIPTKSAELFLSAGGSFTIDKTEVTLYKCHLLSSDCSRCLTLDPRYLCSWCGRRCTFHKFCPIGSSPSELIPSRVCPAPYINSIYPVAGPVEGGTKITIRGRDLGTRVEDVRGRVFIANRVPCKVVEYEVSTKIVCVTERSKVSLNGSLKVALGPDNRREAESKEIFTFLKPTLLSFYPSLGPRSGGTVITISGNHLNVGSEMKVWLGEAECKVENSSRISSTGDTVKCVTTPGRRDNWTAKEMKVQLDAEELLLRNAFRYTPDPAVSSIQPMQSFRSGGRQLMVKGTFLNSTVAPKMFFVDPIKLRARQKKGDISSPEQLPPLASEMSDCLAENATVTWCKSPPLLQKVIRVRRGRDASAVDLSPYPKWPVGFLMDGAKGVWHLDDRFEITVVPDPEYLPFAEEKKLYRDEGEPLILEGRYLSLASQPEDVRVFIGEEVCNVTLVAPNQLVCQPPVEQPAPTDADGNAVSEGRPLVTVRVGFLEFRLGVLAYQSAGGFGSGESVHPGIVVGMLMGVAVIVVVAFVLVAVWWRKKSCEAEKEYKRIQLQMDTMESNVRMECKQAFAELQTDMSDLTTDLLAIGIPYHTRRSYAAKILFKDELQQGLLLDWQNCSGNGYSSNLHVALAQFESLLWNKQFILQLVDTLERQQTFSAQDRVYVASLLTAALARNMQYCTEVVMLLLRQLVDKSVQSRYPQLMLRRTESVVEKMLANWIALCLFDYLQDQPGASLFLLFRALKHQIEKGPVDAVTGEARYSLSEDRLLKEQIEAEPLLLHVLLSSEGKPGETVPCRVLSCDSISQTKMKIWDQLYRNNPFSTRPSIQDFDLEWKCSPKGHVILSDDKVGQHAKDGWKRIGTLQDYAVTSGSLIALIPRSRSSYTYTNSSSQTYTSISSSTLLIPNGHQSPAENSENGSRYWHLVRPPSMCLSDCGAVGTTGRHGQRNPSASLTKSIPEVYLTRLLTSKGTVQKFVDDFFSSALRVNVETFPPVVKYLFDFLESEAHRCQVADQSVVYAWKNNSLPLRFWVNIIKNPEFVFDIEKSATADACLSVVAQTFMDACSPSECRLGKDSPSNKLLFAKDLPRYREMVTEFYRNVRNLPPVTDQDMNAHMAQLSKSYNQEFNVLSAVRELLCYAVKYSEVLLSALDEDSASQRHKLADRLEQVLVATSGGHIVNNTISESIYATVK